METKRFYLEKPKTLNQGAGSLNSSKSCLLPRDVQSMYLYLFVHVLLLVGRLNSP